MKVEKNAQTYFASCPRMLEDLLEAEIKQYKARILERQKGGIRFEADINTLLDIILNTRIASRVYKDVHSFIIKNEDDIYTKGVEKWWHKIFRVDQTFKIQTIFDREATARFKNSIFCSQKLKDAIVDEFRKEKDERPDVQTRNPDVSLLQRIERSEKAWRCRILLDLCGEPLSNRGYRQKGHAAPLRENLAAALIMSSDFDPEVDIFIDPMCGSGTILIEAVLIKAKVAPSYLKIRSMVEKRNTTFSFLKHLWFKNTKDARHLFKKKTTAIYNHSINALADLPIHQFYGCDMTTDALKLTREHLKRTFIPKGVVALHKADATSYIPEVEAPGIVMTNPPYGKRLGADEDATEAEASAEDEKLGELYHNLGENLKNNYPGYRAYVFTSNPELRKKISLQTKQRIPFHNGNIECRLLKYELY